jgi:hypothetical protein
LEHLQALRLVLQKVQGGARQIAAKAVFWCAVEVAALHAKQPQLFGSLSFAEVFQYAAMAV